MHFTNGVRSNSSYFVGTLKGSILNDEIFTISSIKRLNYSLFSFIIHFIEDFKNFRCSVNTFVLTLLWNVVYFVFVLHCQFFICQTRPKNGRKKSYLNEIPNKLLFDSLHFFFLHTIHRLRNYYIENILALNL